MNPTSGSCLCGAVKFTATPKNDHVGVCHCSTCRRMSAGPFMALDCGDSLKFESEDSLGVYNSSAWAERGFCRQCGTQIFWRVKDRSVNIVSVNALDDLGALRLHHEIFIDEKPDYYSFAEDARRLTGEEAFKLAKSGQEIT